MNGWTEEEMQELLSVVGGLAKKYTGGVSSSVTYETAQELMEAVLYCIQEYEQELSLGFALAVPGSASVQESCQKGYELVVRKVKKMRAFYNHLSGTFCSYGSRICEDIMQKGMPEFFRRYDARFAPQKTILTLDYPTLLPLGELTGIDAVEQYLSDLSLEQRFLGAFEESFVCRVLRAYDWNYEEQFFNLCGIFLEYVLLCIRMGKPLLVPFEQKHLDWLDQWSTFRQPKEIQEELSQILRRLVKEQFRGNELLLEYLFGVLPDLAARLGDSGGRSYAWMEKVG